MDSSAAKRTRNRPDLDYDRVIRWHRSIRAAALARYGGKCGCCGETEPVFLAIDHIDGSGAEHRRKIGGGGSNFLRWLHRNNYPDGFQVLCHNCNFAKHTRGTCPHQER